MGGTFTRFFCRGEDGGAGPGLPKLALGGLGAGAGPQLGVDPRPAAVQEHAGAREHGVGG